MKDEVEYEVQSFDRNIGVWYTVSIGIESKKKAKDEVRYCKKFNRESVKYRILKLTIKKEVVYDEL